MEMKSDIKFGGWIHLIENAAEGRKAPIPGQRRFTKRERIPGGLGT